MKRPGARALVKDERGASAVEFALIASVFFMMILGMVSGGLAYSRKLAILAATREGVRYAATMPTGTSTIPDSWFDAVATRTLDSATGDLAETWPGQYICVAYIGYGSPATSSIDRTRKREKSGTNAAVYTDGSVANPATWCFNDGRGTTGDERRVQIVARRDTTFQALVFSKNLSLQSASVARFEVTPPT